MTKVQKIPEKNNLTVRIYFSKFIRMEVAVEAKLTLKLDNAIIESAKKYAKKNNRSLSGMVETYFRNLSSEFITSQKHSPVVGRLTGVLSEDDLEKFAMEDERARYILKREI